MLTLNEALKAAGLQQQKQQVNEASEFDGKGHMHSSGPSMGIRGNMVVLDDNPAVRMLAEILGVPDGWRITKVAGGYAAYNSGDRFTFADYRDDIGEDDE